MGRQAATPQATFTITAGDSNPDELQVALLASFPGCRVTDGDKAGSLVLRCHEYDASRWNFLTAISIAEIIMGAMILAINIVPDPTRPDARLLRANYTLAPHGIHRLRVLGVCTSTYSGPTEASHIYRLTVPVGNEMPTDSQIIKALADDPDRRFTLVKEVNASQ